jgi:iron(III) transport system permease protein
MSARTTRLATQYGLLGVLLAMLAAFLLYPIWLTVRGGFASDPAAGTGWTLEHVRMVFVDPRTRDGLVHAGQIALATTALCVVIALPMAVLAARFRFPGKAVFSAAALVPLILPPFVGAIGMKMVLGRHGALNALLGTDWDILGNARFWGVVVVQALHLYPIIYLNATAALANLDPALDEAAENVGAGWWRRFVRITLPLIRPGLFAGGTIVFIWAFTELGTPLMFDYDQVTSVQIFKGLKEVEGSARPYALTVVLLGVSIGLYVLGKLVFGGRGHAMYAKASRSATETTLTGWKGWAASGLFLVVGLLAVVPHLGVVITSLTVPGTWYDSVLPAAWTGAHFGEALGARESFGSITNSLTLSSLAVVVNVVLGVLVAYLIVRTTVRGRAVLDALCMLPLAVPGLVMAFGYVAMTLGWPFERELRVLGVTVPAFLDGTVLDLEVLGTSPNPFPLLVIAYAVRRLPYIVRSAAAGLEQTSGELEEAAVNLGASRPMAVWKVIVPLITANLIAGGLLVFSFSMLEVSDSLILAQKAEHFPITKMIFEFTNRLGDGPYIGSAMGVWGMALLTVTLVGASVMMGKKLGSIFRA